MQTARERRKAELRELRTTDPVKLIALYRNANVVELRELPAGTSFAAMIEAILNHEEQDGKLAG